MLTSYKPDLSVVIPVYRSAGTLEELLTRLHAAVGGLVPRYEIILVDDGSPDDSWKVLQGLGAHLLTNVIAVQLMRNFGQHNALMCGFKHAQGEVVITIDDDLQNPPEEIPVLYRALVESEADLVYGRYVTKNHAKIRNLGSSMVNAFYKRVFHTNVTVTSFRAMRRALVEGILAYDLNYTFIDGLAAWNTTRITAVDVRHEPRREGRSGYTPWRLVLLALNLFTNFSIVPLQVVSGIGFGAAVCGLGTGVYYLLQYVRHSILVPGYASTIIVILVLGGVQLLALGMMGEYLGRLHLNVNRKPQYRERRVLLGGNQDRE